MLQLLIILTSSLLQITEFGTSYFKIFRKIVSMLNNYHCNLNSKFNNLFHSLNVLECTLGCQYISVTLYLLQIYSSRKPLFKGQSPVNLTPTPLSSYVQNSSTSLTLDVQFQTNSPSLSKL